MSNNLNDRPLDALKNMSNSLVAKLHDVGIHTEAKLRELGAIQAYRRIFRKHPSAGASVWLYVFSLEGALQNRPWRAVSQERGRELFRTLACCQ